MTEQSDIRDILGEMANGPITNESKLVQVLRHFSAHNVPLKTCADNRHTGRKISTLKRYACRLSLKFPDWVPMHLRPKKAKKAKAA
jgi:hypothetical protein